LGCSGVRHSPVICRPQPEVQTAQVNEAPPGLLRPDAASGGPGDVLGRVAERSEHPVVLTQKAGLSEMGIDVLPDDLSLWRHLKQPTESTAGPPASPGYLSRYSGAIYGSTPAHHLNRHSPPKANERFRCRNCEALDERGLRNREDASGEASSFKLSRAGALESREVVLVVALGRENDAGRGDWI
jgi:hypothetical protein